MSEQAHETPGKIVDARDPEVDVRHERPHVLLVDDDRHVHRWLGTTLTLDGWRVTSALTGAQALEAVGRSRPSLVILDNEMPGIRGIECARHLRRLDPELPVVIFSSSLDLDGERVADELGVPTISKLDQATLLQYVESVRASLSVA